MSGLMITFNANPAHLVVAVGGNAAERLLSDKRAIDRASEQETIFKILQNELKTSQENLLVLLWANPAAAVLLQGIIWVLFSWLHFLSIWSLLKSRGGSNPSSRNIYVPRGTHLGIAETFGQIHLTVGDLAL
jgi:hypothetical protein